MKKIGLYYFTNDLRVNDNSLLEQASQQVDELICLFIFPELSGYVIKYSSESHLGTHQQQFISQSCQDLNHQLSQRGQHLFVVRGDYYEVLNQCITENSITHFFSSQSSGDSENSLISHLKNDFPHTTFTQAYTTTLFDRNGLPFDLSSLPSSFSQFRKQVEHLPIQPPITSLRSLPPAPVKLFIPNHALLPVHHDDSSYYQGGEQAGVHHLNQYFSHTFASNYKKTRNKLDGFNDSTKFSLWLAQGCLSPRTVYQYLCQYERHHGANDSTYWIFFELLWREYFYWKALQQGKQLFHSSTSTIPPPSKASVQSFSKWKSGNTGYPIVDACMRQLNATGYMSNRGRQLVASCLIHELGIDWHYGAAYFESQLIDYDVASNWGNWAYIAGESSNISKYFDLAKQTEMYDPEHLFINKWLNCQDKLALDHGKQVHYNR
ncbi:FAD-binding protein [Vibrio sp. 10N.286.49.B3]|uniref:DASH family cryptochrome n=1 Tax=Vibrio sp. 10N.286.49.B3 TaxID=1880855 RepID=UPI000C85F770|nr:DASH family cryptochrome [Vibrio sp. 10N.286.49.B3]PMH44458.1 FAD-binding protein [Vibrio sp. 10N.286.49.B3]